MKQVLLLSLCGVLAAACNRGTEPAEPATEDAVEKPPSAEAEHPGEAEQPGGASRAASVEAQKPKTMEEVVAMLTSASVEAQAAEAGETLCERAHSGQAVFIRRMVELSGQGEAPVVDRAEFISICDEAPVEVQQCLVLSYAAANREECQALKEKVDPELTARFQALMQKARDKSAAAP